MRPTGVLVEQVPALALREVLHPRLAVDDRHGPIKRPREPYHRAVRVMTIGTKGPTDGAS